MMEFDERYNDRKLAGQKLTKSIEVLLDYAESYSKIRTSEAKNTLATLAFKYAQALEEYKALEELYQWKA